MIDQKEISKFLSYVLRHDPGSIGLELDAGGWGKIDHILAKAKPRFTRADLLKVVANSDKQRFALSADGLRIRANQGHSIPVDLGLSPQTPPDQLFHGTATRFLDAILQEGLRAGTRQHVHLSADLETARNVGQRHGKPVILTINCAAMLRDEHRFYLSENGVWLTDHVPPRFLSKLS